MNQFRRPAYKVPKELVGVGVGVLMLSFAYPHAQPPQPAFIKTDLNTFVATKNVRWAKEDVDEKCWYMCTNNRGCSINNDVLDKWSVCESKTPKSYERLNKMFQNE